MSRASTLAETAGRTAPAAPSTGLHRLACATAAWAFLVLFAGGMVTSTGSGLSVPDWPLAFGKVFPPMAGGVLFEHGHRMVAGIAAVLIGLLAWRARVGERRRWVRVLAYAAAAGVLAQALLGGLTVLLQLPAPVSIGHACLGQTVFCLVVAVAQATSPWYLRASASHEPAGPWPVGAAAFAVLFLQLVWGAVVRHTGQLLPLHMAWAGLAVFAAGFAAYVGLSSRRERPELAGPSILLAGLLPAQLGLGVLAYAIRHSDGLDLGFRTSAAFVTAHLAAGALLLATSVVWTLRARRLS